jgi:excisionase family DNA binding protein
MSEIRPYEIYTTKETELLLKVSKSTLKRLLKSGLLRAKKVGKQYRIMGHEILTLVSPRLDKKATSAYQKIKLLTHNRMEDR